MVYLMRKYQFIIAEISSDVSLCCAALLREYQITVTTISGYCYGKVYSSLY